MGGEKWRKRDRKCALGRITFPSLPSDEETSSQGGVTFITGNKGRRMHVCRCVCVCVSCGMFYFYYK